MTNRESAVPHGIYAATLAPMHEDFALDEATLAAHVASMAGVSGMRGLLINGHAGENFALTRSEKRRVVELAREQVGRDCHLICGVNSESSLALAQHAHDAAEAGADSILVFPPNSWALSLAPETALRHHRTVVDAVDLPIVLYQAPVGAGSMAYGPALLESLLQLPRVAAIKEGSWESATYEANRRLVAAVAPDVAVMASGDEHLLSCFVLGSDGSQVSLAVIIPETIIALDAAVRSGDLERAKRAHEIIYPLARAIYGTPPGGHATARLKTCLYLLGRLPRDITRAPIGPLPEPDVQGLRNALATAGLKPVR